MRKRPLRVLTTTFALLACGAVGGPLAAPAPSDDPAPGPAADAVLGTPPVGNAARGPRDSDAPLTWSQVGRDETYLFTRPAHLDRRGWERFSWAIGIGASLYLVRHDARDFVQDHRTGTIDNVLDDARTMGKVATPFVTAGAFYLVGLGRDSAKDKETATLLLETLGSSAAIAGTGQVVVASERPRDGDAVRFFGRDGHSVSGDVTVAASMLAPIVDRHLRVGPEDGTGKRFWKRFGTWALYSTAGLVALQRMDKDAHWLPDAYFGYVDGLCVGRMLVDARRGGRAWRERGEGAAAEGGPAEDAPPGDAAGEPRPRVGRGPEVDVSPAGVRITWP